MHIESFREYCFSKAGVEEGFPFGEDVLVMKVMGKIWALTGLSEADFRVNLKFEPEYAIELRGDHPQIIPGWHMNKKHWNTVYFEDGLSDKLLIILIDQSYDLVAASLTKKLKEELQALQEATDD
jgi:predicted DNA-binding protein (MmcQ/YjbR family)